MLIILLITIPLCLALLKGNNIEKNNLIVKYSKIEINSIKTGFITNNIFYKKNNFYLNEDDIYTVLKTINTEEVIPNREISFTFKEKPESYIVVEIIPNKNYNTLINNNSIEDGINYIITPSEYGKHIYSVCINYTEYTETYYFSINVNSPIDVIDN